MAVSLTRQGDEQHRSSSPEQHQVNKLPQVTIRNLPILTPEHFQNGPVTGRTQTVYSCNSPGRETFWKENYERRQSQLNEGGFHGSPGHKYREVGNVELDDKTLILQALGQMNLHQQHPPPTSSDHHRESDTKSTDITVPPPSSSTEVCKSPNLRARAASQLPANIMKLQNELERADLQLDKIRKGSGLFDMFHKEKAKKESEELRLKIEEENAKGQEWLPSSIVTNDELQLDELPSPNLQENQTMSTTNEESETPEYRVSLAYSKLCTILWILECMRLESPQHMQSLHSFWHPNRPPVNEEKGQRVFERTTTLLRQYDHITMSDRHTQPVTKLKEHKKQQKRPTSKQQQFKIEEEKIRKQRKLSPEQIEKLKQLIEEELNHTKKKSRNSLKQLMEEKALMNSSPKKLQGNTVSDIKLDANTIASSFNAVDETREMIVHEQLSAMARDRQEALEQRFSSLRVSGNMWIDLKRMRQGVEIETTAMASNKLIMNYNWLVQLEKELPDEAFKSRYCQELLAQLSTIQDYMRQVGPQQMSQERLMSVLSLLRPWELQSTTVAQAVKFMITQVIYTVPEDYEAWLEYHTKKYNHTTTRSTTTE